MKTLVLACVAALAMAIPAMAGTEVCIKVDGMSCGGCEGKVKRALAKMEGVKLTAVSSKTGTANVTLEGEKATKAAVMAAINGTGLKAAGEVVSYKVDGMSCGACEGKVKKALAKMEGVTTQKVCAKSGSAVVVLESDKASAEAVKKTIAGTGFTVK